MRSTKAGIAATAALGAAAFAAVPTGGTALAQGACKPATNIEAIIDDSGSMAGTDRNRLRDQGINLLINKPANANKKLGAVAFGSSATQVFAPLPIGSSIGPIGAALAARTLDDGSTYYERAFAAASAGNPTADARIFLTDGEPTDSGGGWQGGPKTYTVGLGLTANGSGETLLKGIASGTGGAYVRADSDATLQAAINDVDAFLNCKAVPKRYSDTFTKTGSKSHSLPISRGIKTVELTLTWASPTDQLDIVGVSQSTKGKASAAARRVKVTKRSGSTFVSAKISRIKKGKLKFKVRLKKKGTPFLPVTATTQATRSKTR